MSQRTQLLVVGAVVALAIAAVVVTLALAPPANTAMSPRPVPTPIVETPTPAAPAPTPPPTPEPATPRPTPYENVVFEASQDGRVEVLTVAGSSCKLSGQLPGGQPFSASGMERPVIADRGGRAHWEYSTQVTGGGGTHFVTCTINGLTATVSAGFVGGS